MNCYNCGALSEPGQKFCDTCGARAHSGPDDTQRTANNELAPPDVSAARQNWPGPAANADRARRGGWQTAGGGAPAANSAWITDPSG